MLKRKSVIETEKGAQVMNVNRNLLAALLLWSGIGVGAAGAADDSWLFKQGFFGSPAQGKPDVTLKISDATGTLWAEHFTTARFQDAKGASFVWRFDGTTSVSNFPLKMIAPPGFNAGGAYVVVTHPANHLSP